MKRVLVDADSCAKRVRLYLISLAKKGLISLFFAANKDLSPNAGQKTDAGQDQGQGQARQEIPNFRMIVSPKESQAADNWILGAALPGDIAITRDIPLAAALFEKNVCVMNDLGKIFDKKNIERALKERELSLQMTQLGLGTKKRDSYGQKEFETFARAFNKLSQA